MMKKLLFALLMMCQSAAMAQNPFLPLWEHVPDGEPYLFDDPDRPGHQRVYIYGSHDTRRTEFCGREQVVWSAPAEDLSQWRYDGVIFESLYDGDHHLLNDDGQGDVLYAPDVAVTTDAEGKKTYWLYPNNQARSRKGMVARSSRPDGPFEVVNWSKSDAKKCDGILKFDPAVFVDDDGRIYGYWGFMRSYAAELNPATMATLKQGTKRIENLIPSCQQDSVYRFFEASSMRKIGDKYVFIYSRKTRKGEFGLPSTNYTLAYAYGDHPLGPFTYGGTIIDARARGTNEAGETIPTANPTGNTHGSLCNIAGQWYVFYHRQTGVKEYSRQAMVAPVTIKVEKGTGGKVTISEAEYTSEGFATEGLDPHHCYPSAIACYLTGPEPVSYDSLGFHFPGPYVEATYPIGNARLPKDSLQHPYDQSINMNPVVNCTNGSIVGYKYFNMDKLRNKNHTKMTLWLQPLGVKGHIDIMADSPWESKGGRLLGSMTFTGTQTPEQLKVSTRIRRLAGLSGKHAIYLVFHSPTEHQSMCNLLYLQLDK